jgi:hypothetical protein
MEHAEQTIVRWSFFLHPDGCWTWLLGGDGGMPDQVSEPCTNFGMVVADAVRHGFNPERHLWAVSRKT